tara:strand:- start:418 stop:1029 length:612 start_codon:yes stop_codon:yes gene_type:complete
MGADGHIHITNPEHIEQFVQDMIFHKYKRDIEWRKSLGQDIIINITEETQNMQFYKTDEEVPDEKIIVHTTSLDDTYDLEVYNYLVNEFNNSLNSDRIPSRAWDRCSDWEEEEFERELARVEANNLNYTYWDTEGWYDSNMYEFFQGWGDEVPTNIYNDTIKSEKKSDWYETFIESFPSVEEFIEIMDQYKSVVELDSIQMWT